MTVTPRNAYSPDMHFTCTAKHTLDAMEAYIVVNTVSREGKCVVAADDESGPTTNYGAALAIAQQRRRGAPWGHYARIDVLYACGCRGTL